MFRNFQNNQMLKFIFIEDFNAFFLELYNFEHFEFQCTLNVPYGNWASTKLAQFIML